MTSPYSFLGAPTDAVALEDAGTGTTMTYRELAAQAGTLANRLRGPRSLVFCFCRQDARSVVSYLGAIAADHAVALMDDAVPDELKRALIEHYRPRYVVGPDPSAVEEPFPTTSPPVHPDLCVLLSTSGSTGSPKLVRLSHDSVAANAQSIVEYLGIDATERAAGSLPIHYSYGLSVLHSHLLAGARIVFTPHSILRPEFWRDFADRRCTSFAGVPYSYTMLQRTGFARHELPHLRTMTQAGGRMAPETIIEFHTLLGRRGARLFVMYGQTEATARIAYVPPERLPEKAGSIGVAIPRGRIAVEVAGRPAAAGETGEIVYEGPNVMLGYAEDPDDLALGDVMGGRLPTGDLGHFDEDGFHFVTGRSKRIAKVHGSRINLDEIERAVRGAGTAAVVAAEDRIVVFRVGRADDDLRRTLAQRFNLNARVFDVRDVESLPLLGSGKVDYETLTAMVA